jgi:hypothetical protein
MKNKKIMSTCLTAALSTAFLIPVNAQIQDGGNNAPRGDALVGIWKICSCP